MRLRVSHQSEEHGCSADRLMVMAQLLKPFIFKVGKVSPGACSVPRAGPHT